MSPEDELREIRAKMDRGELDPACGHVKCHRCGEKVPVRSSMSRCECGHTAVTKSLLYMSLAADPESLTDEELAEVQRRARVRPEPTPRAPAKEPDFHGMPLGWGSIDPVDGNDLATDAQWADWLIWDSQQGGA